MSRACAQRQTAGIPVWINGRTDLFIHADKANDVVDEAIERLQATRAGRGQQRVPGPDPGQRRLLIGYARVSTTEQDLTAQRDGLTRLGVEPSRIYVHHGLTGTNRARPSLREALAACRAGDTLVVTKLDRLARSLPDAHLADFAMTIYLDMDRSGTYLKAVGSALMLMLSSTLDRTPLLRLEYRADMHSDPIAHWQFHAERGAFSHLLTRAHAHRPGRVGKPHDLSSVHLPVGGERFRPCLEDFLQLLVVDCGVDSQEGWETAIKDGRESWRRRQLGSAVRDVPSEAVRVLTELGWSCSPPEGAVAENLVPLRAW
jgi:hypothetical protein